MFFCFKLNAPFSGCQQFFFSPRQKHLTKTTHTQMSSTARTLGSHNRLPEIQQDLIRIYKTLNPTEAEFTATFAGTVMTVTAVASGTILLGQTLSGVGVVGSVGMCTSSGAPTSVKISALDGTGTGGVGTYSINQPLTLGPTAVSAKLKLNGRVRNETAIRATLAKLETQVFGAPREQINDAYARMLDLRKEALGF